MTIASLQTINKVFGGRSILNGLNWTIDESARVGLVGPNGAGKSTLLRILAGTESVESGEVVRKRGTRIAFLPQHIETSQETPMELALAARRDLQTLEQQLNQCESDMSSPEVFSDMKRMERALADQERLLRAFEELGGPGFAGETRSYLLGLGLAPTDIDKPMSRLSGGQRKLVVLAVCLAQRPDLLLLDEPETHLDLLRREYLESLIRSFSGAVVVVSHDRYLLDETVSQIAELSDGTIKIWPGNYSAYAVARELALQRQQQLFSAQQQEIERLEEAIKRFKLWASMVANERHIKQARNKQRQIDHMEKVERPVLERRKMALRLRSALRGGQKAFELRAVARSFGDNLVLKNASLGVRRGERVGVVGPNGAGKTVLARLITGEVEPSGGEVWRGPSIEIGYFSQGQENLDMSAAALELVRRARPLSENEGVSVLLQFLFTYDQIRQPVHTLSGGERSRLQLLLLMLGGANCLVLDEPTNHLDIDSAEVLEGALEQFDGTVVVISHDRYFLDRIVDRMVELDTGVLTQYEGGYSALMTVHREETIAGGYSSAARPSE